MTLMIGSLSALDFYAILVITVERCAFTFAEKALLRCLQQPCETKERNTKDQVSHAQVNDLFDFHHLRSRKGMSQRELEGEVQDDLKHAAGQFT